MLLLGILYASRIHLRSNGFDEDIDAFGESDPVICFNNVTRIPQVDLSPDTSTKFNQVSYIRGLLSRDTNGTYGMFVCPLGKDETKNFCCGPEFQEYCCGFWDE